MNASEAAAAAAGALEKVERALGGGTARDIMRIKNTCQAQAFSLVAPCLPCKNQVLSSVPGTEKKKLPVSRWQIQASILGT